MPLHQPELGGRKVVTVRYRVTVGPCIGVHQNDDQAASVPNALMRGINARVLNGILVCRGGQELRNLEAMDGKVFGVIDTEGEFDGLLPGRSRIYGTVTNTLYADVTAAVFVVSTTNPPTLPYTRSIDLPDLISPGTTDTYSMLNLTPGSYFTALYVTRPSGSTYEGIAPTTLTANVATQVDITLS